MGGTTVPERGVATPARPGARWTDTIARVAEHEGFRQAMRGRVGHVTLL